MTPQAIARLEIAAALAWLKIAMRKQTNADAAQLLSTAMDALERADTALTA